MSSLRKRLSRNMSWTFAGELVISLGAVATLFITARALGPANLGILALVESFVRIVDLILRIEPWQAVIRYAIKAQERGDEAGFLRLIKLSLMIDAAGGLLSGSVCILLAPFVAPWIGLPPEGATYIAVFAVGLFLSFRPTATVVLRVFDRFDLLAKLNMLSALVRLLLTVAAWLAGLGLWAFLLIMLIQSLMDGLLCLVLAVREMRRRGQGGFLRAEGLAAIGENPGILRFMWNSNFNVILRQSANRFDVLALGALTNPAAVGIYQLGKRVMNRVVKLAGPVRQAIYPELSRLWEKGKVAEFDRLILIVSSLLLVMQLIVAVPVMMNIETIIRIVFGEAYVGAGPVMNILLLSSIVFASGVALNPALLSMGKDWLLVRVTLISTLIFAISFMPMVHLWGVEGAAISNLLFNVIWTIGCAFGLRHSRAQTRSGQ